MHEERSYSYVIDALACNNCVNFESIAASDTPVSFV